PGIWKLILQVKVHVDRYRRLTLPQLGRMAEVIAEHEPILEGIERRDPERARAAMASHLERLLDDISEIQNLNPDYFDQPT
ncbi:FCD domain-containing protein, partial [Bradyrhizobium sp.]